MTQVQLNGVQLNYEVVGQGEPLFLIGGCTANCREWQRMRDELAKRFSVYMPENRGAGLTTDWGPEFTIADMADDIALLMRYLGIEQANLVGHSMGGAIALQLCINYPTRVKAAIIASSFAHFPKAAQLYLESTSELFAAGLNAKLVLRTIYTRLYGSAFLTDEANIHAELDRMLTDPVLQTPSGYAAQVRALAQFDVRDKLHLVRCPTLIINGHDDVLTPSALSETLQQGIAQSRLSLLSECGHMIPQEQPRQFCQLINSFFVTPLTN